MPDESENRNDRLEEIIQRLKNDPNFRISSRESAAQEADSQNTAEHTDDNYLRQREQELINYERELNNRNDALNRRERDLQRREREYEEHVTRNSSQESCDNDDSYYHN